MLERAVAYMKEHPLENAYATFNNQKGQFVRGDLYVFAFGLDDGIMHAHGAAPEGLVGLNVADLRDASGKPLIREMMEVARSKGSGTVDYVWLNRVTNKLESKTAFVRLVGKSVVGVGYYVPRSSAEEARAFLDNAIQAMRSAGAGEAFAMFNDKTGIFVRDDLYVFAVGLEDAKFYAMGANPGLVGMDVKDLKDASGKPIIRDMIALVKEKGTATYDYVWRNPANNKIEPKESYVQKFDAYMVGVGHYIK
jgi:cytochrome c